MEDELSTMNCLLPLGASAFSAPLRYLLILTCVLLGCALPAAAEYAVLRSGRRIRITGYERVECRLQAEGTRAVSAQVEGQQERSAQAVGAPAASTNEETAQATSRCYVLHMRGGRLEVPAAEILTIEPEDAFGPAAAPMPRSPYDTLIAAAALRHRLDEKLIASVIAAESNFDPRAISPKNARGLMQLMPETARRLGVTDIFDPEQNINAGTRYLRELLDRYSGDLTLALAAYNAGPERVAQYRGVPPFPETRAYLSRISARLHDTAPFTFGAASAPASATVSAAAQ
jgi:hypothetical protein